jgi:hypothetical protein
VSIFTVFNLPHIHCYHSQTLKSHCRTLSPDPTTALDTANNTFYSLPCSDDSLIVILATQMLFSYDYTCENAAMHTLVGLHTVHFSLVLHTGILKLFCPYLNVQLKGEKKNLS